MSLDGALSLNFEGIGNHSRRPNGRPENGKGGTIGQGRLHDATGKRRLEDEEAR